MVWTPPTSVRHDDYCLLGFWSSYEKHSFVASGLCRLALDDLAQEKCQNFFMIDGGFMEGYTFSSPFWALASDVFL